MITYPDHLLTHSHELKVELRVDHLGLLQFEDLLVTPLGQMLFIVLQTLNHLHALNQAENIIKAIKMSYNIWSI